MEKVLLAVGEPQYSKILTDYIQKEGDSFQLSSQEVMHFQYMDELLEAEKPDILIVHDYYLPNLIEAGKERESKWLDYFEDLRTRYDDQIRIVFLCERDRNDPFLRQLVNANVLDVFETNAINMDEFINQLKDKPRFSRVAKFKASFHSVSDDKNQHQVNKEVNDVQEEEEYKQPKEQTEQSEKANSKEKSPKKEHREKSVKKPQREKKEKTVVNKIVEKKVINKQVVKREYKFQVTNEVEKVVGVPIEKKLILIGSPFPRSGSTFISHLLAESLRDLEVPVTYIESPYSKSYTYDRFYGHEHMPDYRSHFYKYTKDSEPNDKTKFDWNFEGVDLIVKHPNNEPIYTENDVPFDRFIKLLLANPSTVTIMDVGTDWMIDVYQDLVDIATDIYMVLEPDISNMQYIEDPDHQDMAYFHDLFEDPKTKLIGNRFDPSILENPIIQDLYYDRFLTTFPAYPSHLLFEAQFQGEFVKKMLQKHDKKNQKRKDTPFIDQQLEPILETLVPKELLKNKQSVFKGLWNKKITLHKEK